VSDFRGKGFPHLPLFSPSSRFLSNLSFLFYSPSFQLLLSSFSCLFSFPLLSLLSFLSTLALPFSLPLFTSPFHLSPLTLRFSVHCPRSTSLHLPSPLHILTTHLFQSLSQPLFFSFSVSRSLHLTFTRSLNLYFCLPFLHLLNSYMHFIFSYLVPFNLSLSTFTFSHTQFIYLSRVGSHSHCNKVTVKIP